MKMSVKVNVNMENYWVIRGIKWVGSTKKCVAEKEFDHEPTEDEIAECLLTTDCDFVSVIQNYRKGEET